MSPQNADCLFSFMPPAYERRRAEASRPTLTKKHKNMQNMLYCRARRGGAPQHVFMY